MITAKEVQMSVSATGDEVPRERVLSLDVFRGLTILVMIFVNEVAGIQDVPAWMRHAPENSDAMTFVDLVFPAFLFIVGMSIPLAVERRVARGDSLMRICGHVLVRTLGLLLIGVYMVNIHGFRADLAGISRDCWVLLLYLGVVLVWNRYPQSAGPSRWLFRSLRLAGIVLLVVLAVIYRGGQGQGVTRMQTSWWGILGLIGWAYLIASTAYLLFRSQIAVLVGMVGLLTAVFVGDKDGALGFLGLLHQYVNIGGHWGGHGSIAVAGVVLGMLFLPGSPARSPSRRIIWMLVFGIGLLAGGFLLRPLYGISKVQATPTWCLCSAGMCCGLYAVLYWLVDVQGISRWSFILRPAGADPLLAYILPAIVASLLGVVGIEYLDTHLNTGLPGIARSAVFAFAIVAITGLLYRLRVRLHL
jgi:heparan-alpha-glucosaminide N-acetyltransferase